MVRFYAIPNRNRNAGESHKHTYSTKNIKSNLYILLKYCTWRAGAAECTSVFSGTKSCYPGYSRGVFPSSMFTFWRPVCLEVGLWWSTCPIDVTIGSAVKALPAYPAPPLGSYPWLDTFCWKKSVMVASCIHNTMPPPCKCRSASTTCTTHNPFGQSQSILATWFQCLLLHAYTVCPLNRVSYHGAIIQSLITLVLWGWTSQRISLLSE